MTRRGLCVSAGAVVIGLSKPAWADDWMAYGTDPRQRLRLFSGRGAGPHPLVIMAVGAERVPDRALALTARALAARGMSVAVVDRRPSRHGFQAHTSDIVRALAYLLERGEALSLDGRFALWGQGGGANAVLLIARDRRYLAAAHIDARQHWGTVALGVVPETDPTFTRPSAYGTGTTPALYQGRVDQAAQGTAFLNGLF